MFSNYYHKSDGSHNTGLLATSDAVYEAMRRYLVVF